MEAQAALAFSRKAVISVDGEMTRLGRSHAALS
jgi:hypothetical protein